MSTTYDQRAQEAWLRIKQRWIDQMAEGTDESFERANFLMPGTLATWRAEGRLK